MKQLSFFKNVQRQRLGILVLMLCLLAPTTLDAQVKRAKRTEKDGFVWYLTFTDNRLTSWGAQDKNGNTIIPLSRGYTLVSYDKGLFTVGKSDGLFYEAKNKSTGICDKNGKEIISPDRGYEVIVPYENYFGITKNGKCGACDLTGKEIIAPIYENLAYFPEDGAFKLFSNGNLQVILKYSSSATSYASSSSNSSSSRSTASTSTTQSQATTSYGEQMTPCPVCYGTGQITYYDVNVNFVSPCPACGATGKVPVSVAAKAAEMQMSRGSSGTGSHSHSSSSTRKKDCKVCHNTGICQTCLGKGEVFNSYTNKWSYCSYCNKNYENAHSPRKGKCYACW